MNILILGASGATGHALVEQALSQGHVVSAFVRNPSKLRISQSNLKVMQGDVTDYALVERAIKYQDAVISALGAATPFKQDPALNDGVRNVIKAMEQWGVKRFIYLSFVGVRECRGEMGFLVNHVISHILHNAIADHEIKESVIRQSRLEWTIVRPPKLTNGQQTGVYRSGEDIKPTSFILQFSRADLADFMLKQLTDGRYLRKTPRVMY